MPGVTGRNFAFFTALRSWQSARTLPGEKEHDQTIVVNDLLADRFTPVKYGPLLAVKRMRQRGLGQPHRPGVDRGIPREGELARVGLPPKGIGPARAKADPGGGVAHAVSVGERGDERRLSRGRPAGNPAAG